MGCEDELEPLWARYPWIIQGSMGWRMGMGESYAMQWWQFAERELTSVERAFEFLSRHPPAPRTWTDMLVDWLAELPAAPAPESLRDELDERDLVGDDVAYPVFLRNTLRDGGMTAPWTWRGGSDPSSMLRHGTRELGWWARWFATECSNRREWLAAQPPAPPV